MARKLVSREQFDRIAGESRVSLRIAYNAWAKPTRAQVTSALDRKLTGPYTLRHIPDAENYEFMVVSRDDMGEIASLPSQEPCVVAWSDLEALARGTE